MLESVLLRIWERGFRRAINREEVFLVYRYLQKSDGALTQLCLHQRFDELWSTGVVHWKINFGNFTTLVVSDQSLRISEA